MLGQRQSQTPISCAKNCTKTPKCLISSLWTNIQQMQGIKKNILWSQQVANSAIPYMSQIAEELFSFTVLSVTKLKNSRCSCNFLEVSQEAKVEYFLWCPLQSILCRLRGSILCFFCRCYFYGVFRKQNCVFLNFTTLNQKISATKIQK